MPFGYFDKKTHGETLSIITNVGHLITEEIIKNREEQYKDFIDFVTRNYSKGVNKKVLLTSVCLRKPKVTPHPSLYRYAVNDTFPHRGRLLSRNFSATDKRINNHLSLQKSVR